MEGFGQVQQALARLQPRGDRGVEVHQPAVAG
jgi:hypothetical protein